MKIVIAQDELFEGIQRVFNVVPQKPTLPVLSNFLLRVQDNRLFVSGTDMDISITTSIECSVHEEGEVTVNARRFMSIIRELPAGGEVSLTVANDRLTVSFEKGQSSIMGMSADIFPELKDAIEGVEIALPGKDLFEMVERTGFSVATDRTRLALTGVYCHLFEDKVTMVATDGHRLSLMTRSVGVTIGNEAEAIIPPKALSQAARVQSGGTELVKAVFGEGAILFDFGTTTIFSKLIEGPYPNFRQVIPRENSKKIYMPTNEFEASVRRVSVLSNTITHQIRIGITPGTLDLSTTNTEIGGESRESLQVSYEGDSLTVGYNANFLLEILRKIGVGDIVIELESPTTACIIRPADGVEADEYLYLIMPLRLND